MSDVAANKALIAAYLDALNHRDQEAVQRLCSPAYVHHAPRVPTADLSAYLETAARMFQAFPDMVATVDHMMAEDEYVATRYTARGTHQGDFYGLAPTGGAVVLRVIGIQRIVDGKIVEGWFEFDTGEISAQLREGGASKKDEA
jgi:steroid delta-isomerase-like uncharacterized protein